MTTSLVLPQLGPVITPGEVIDGKFLVQELTGNNNHCHFYKVANLSPGACDADFELACRSFIMTGLSDSCASYRRRAMSRLSKRTIHRTELNGMEIIVYKTNTEATTWCAPAADRPPVASGVLEATTKATSCNKRTSKSSTSTYKRMSRRVRQRERRQAARAAQSHNNGEVFHQRSENDFSLYTGFDESTERMFILLHLADNKQFNDELPAGTQLVLKTYQETKDKLPKLENAADMEEFIQTKESEIVFLRRQLHRLPSAITKCHSDLGLWIRQQGDLERASPEYARMQYELIGPARVNLRSMRTAESVLPGVISSAAEQKQRLKHELRQKIKDEKEAEDLARREKKAYEALKTMYKEQDDLSRRADNYKDWKFRVLPASQTFAQLDKRWRESKNRLSLLNGEIDKLKEGIRNFEI